MGQRTHRGGSRSEAGGNTPHQHPTHGGSAAASGISYQDRVAAWYAVQSLTEADLPSRWNLPTTTRVILVRCETGEPVDDILLGTSGGGFIFEQAKHTLALSENADSDLASTLDQFVRQFTQYEQATSYAGMNPWQRRLDPTRDRLALVTSSDSSASVRTTLRRVLNRLRTLADGQPLSAAAVNADERRVLSVTKTHVARSWTANRNSPPTDEDLKALLTLVYVDIIDVDAGKPDEERAIERLATSVLRESKQSQLAWTHLLDLCHQFSIEQSGAELHHLQEYLLRQPLALLGTPSYRADITRLQNLTQDNLRAFENHARIQAGVARIPIQRANTRELLRIAQDASFVLIGKPGSGKTGTLADAAKSLLVDGHDIVLLTADDLAVGGLAQSQGGGSLQHLLAEILRNWPGTQPAYLFVDALDTARTGTQSRRLRDQLRTLLEADGDAGKRWHVVTAVRLFDLAHSPALQDIFAGTLPDVSPELQSPTFAHVRHLLVPRLTDSELAQATGAFSPLADLLRRASSQLRDLLHIPFNLNLAAQLLAQGAESGHLVTVRTHLDLLDRYWDARVVAEDEDQGIVATTRERVLRRLCEMMVNSRALHIAHSEVVDVLADSGADQALEELLQRHVLMRRDTAGALGVASVGASDDRHLDEFTRGTSLAFDHMILFDYAIARLLLRPLTPVKLADRLENERDLILTIAPSLVMYLQQVWSRSSIKQQYGEFWQILQQIVGRHGIPAVTKAIGTTLAAELGATIAEMEPLIQSLTADDPSMQQAAQALYGYLISALDVVERPIVGQGSGPWCSLANQAATTSTPLREQTAVQTAALLARLCDHADQMTDVQRADAGQAARNLLDFAWSQRERRDWLVERAIEAVCCTSASDPLASESLLGRCLTAEHFARYAYQEVPLLANQVGTLAKSLPNFVAKLYVIAFTYEETSQDETAIGSSRILALRSTRRQDYETGRYIFEQAFPTFLRQRPRHALEACLDVLDQIAERRWKREDNQYPFQFMGHEAYLERDASDEWDLGSGREGEGLRLLDALMAHLVDLAQLATPQLLLEELLDIVAKRSQHAIVWRRLLRAGWQNPETLGRAICSLTWALPLLTASETSYDAGELIRQMYPLLDVAERVRIERAILSINSGQDQNATPKERVAIGRIQARLLGCLPDGVLLTEARELRDTLQTAGALPANTEPIARAAAWWGSDEESLPMTEQTGAWATTPESRLEAAATSVASFIEQYRQTVPSLDQIADAWPTIRLLFEALQRSREDGVDREVLQSQWSLLIRACKAIAGAANLTCADEPGVFTRTVLLAATMHSDPQPTPQSEAQFGEFPSWDSNAIRVNAAAGLMVLAQHVTCLNEDVRSAIWRLAADPVASVRTQVAWRVIMLYESDTPLMWKLIDHFSLNEMNYGVLNLLLRDPLARLAGAHGDRVVSHVETIYHRIMTAQDVDRVREACMDIFLNRYLCQDDPVCTHHLDTTINEPEQHGAELQHLLSVLRRPLMLGLPDGDGDGDGDDGNHGSVDVDWGTKASRRQEDEIRGRARGMFRRIVESTRETVQVVETAHVGLSWTQWPETDRERVTTLRRVLDVASREFYFASGAYAAQETENGRELSPGALHLTDAQGSKFLDENFDTLEALADIGDPGAAHHVLKTLSAYLDVNPERVFQLIARTLRAANSRGYPFEAAGAELLVQVVERYLAEYRALFRENDAYRLLLLELLDSFVAVGWPNARRLAMRLEVIDR